ncbi:MAG TPA: SCO family protein [Polyangiaceae bacterium]
MARSRASFVLWALSVVTCSLLAAGEARAQSWQPQPSSSAPVVNALPTALRGVDIKENLGGALPRDAVFRDTEGNQVRLGDYLDGKRPTLLVFAYHTCPMLCSLVLDATVKALDEVPWTVGDQFDVVSISIDPKDTPETAAKKRAKVVDGYRRARGSPKGWHFLTGEETQIRKVTDAVGFEYRYDPVQKQYAHPAAIYLLTPEGRMARYLYGVQYEPNDIRLGLLEASQGRSVSTTERILLYCYHFDPKGGHYNLVALNVMRIGGGVTLAGLCGLLAVAWARDRRKRRKHAPGAGAPAT